MSIYPCLQLPMNLQASAHMITVRVRTVRSPAALERAAKGVKTSVQGFQLLPNRRKPQLAGLCPMPSKPQNLRPYEPYFEGIARPCWGGLFDSLLQPQKHVPGEALPQCFFSVRLSSMTPASREKCRNTSQSGRRV